MGFNRDSQRGFSRPANPESVGDNPQPSPWRSSNRSGDARGEFTGKLDKDFLGRWLIKYDCPECGTRLQSPFEDAGAEDSCPDCGVGFVVPVAEKPAAPVAKPPQTPPPSPPKPKPQPNRPPVLTQDEAEKYIVGVRVVSCVGMLGIIFGGLFLGTVALGVWPNVPWGGGAVFYLAIVAAVVFSQVHRRRTHYDHAVRIAEGKASPTSIHANANAYVEQGGTSRSKLLRSDHWTTLTGVPLEQWVACQLRRDGFTVEETSASGDHGIDLVAENSTVRIAIQVKGWEGSVGNEPVIKTVGGMFHYGARVACVVTNSTFTPKAWDYAEGLANHPSGPQCWLIDAKAISVLIKDGLDAAVKDFERRLRDRSQR